VLVLGAVGLQADAGPTLRVHRAAPHGDHLGTVADEKVCVGCGGGGVVWGWGVRVAGRKHKRVRLKLDWRHNCDGCA
jgi:hypothetical protein